jgi:hypothetical protein
METVTPVGHSQSFAFGEAITLFVSLELSRARWLVTSLSPGSAKVSRHSVVGGNIKDLLHLLADLRMKAEQRTGSTVKIVTIQEIGFDGFWIHRVLASNAIESHVVEASSIAVPRRRRRAKTDAIDGELAAAHPDGLQARGAAGLRDAGGSNSRRGGSAPAITRTQDDDQGTD